MLYIVAAATIEMALSAILAPRHSDVLRYFGQIDCGRWRADDRFRAYFDWYEWRIAGFRRKFRVCARPVMTNKAIDPRLILRRSGPHIIPAIASMTARTTWLV